MNPFSILDTRTKDWKSRKEWWITTYGIQSEFGREKTESRTMFWDTPTNVSIFDPVLCELMYEWFSPKGGSVLDPFAGGSVRGIVAEELGRKYIGIDLSESQIKANKEQSKKPLWLCGDSDLELDKVANESHDFVFTCPPYYDLEIYTDNTSDLSNMDDVSFDEKYKSILQKSATKLKNNRFYCIVVSEVREQSTIRNYKIGKYKRLVSKTIDILEEAGLSFYNDMILFNSQHQASRVGKTYFERNRKIPSVHQNVLVFVKGNPDIATIEIECGEPMCRIDGKEYLSFRHAAIDMNPNELIATEVERRCLSTKSKYKDWQIIGKETKPTIKYIIDGVPFENTKQIVKVIPNITESMARNYCESNNPKFRHWVVAENYDVSYDEMQNLQKNKKIKFELPIISCDGIEFLSLNDAANYFNVSSERIRQKLISNKYPSYFYVF
jgi:DNA modification methylase